MLAFIHRKKNAPLLLWVFITLSQLSNTRRTVMAQNPSESGAYACGGMTLPILPENTYYSYWEASRVAVTCGEGYEFESGKAEESLSCTEDHTWSLEAEELKSSPQCPGGGVCEVTTDYCDPLLYPEYNITFGEVTGCPKGYVLTPGPRTLTCVDNTWLPEVFCLPVCEHCGAGDCKAPEKCLCSDMELRNSCNSTPPVRQDESECGFVTAPARFHNGSVIFECPARKHFKDPSLGNSVELECSNKSWVAKNTHAALSELVCEFECLLNCSGRGTCNEDSQCVCKSTDFGPACENSRCTSEIAAMSNAHFRHNAAHSQADVECLPGFRWPPALSATSPSGSRSVITVFCVGGEWTAPAELQEGCIVDNDLPCGEVVAPPFVEVINRTNSNLTLACKNNAQSVTLEALCEQDSWVTADTREKLRVLTLAAWQKRCQTQDDCASGPAVVEHMNFTVLPERSANLGANVSAGYVGCTAGYEMGDNVSQALVICSKDTNHHWIVYDAWRKEVESINGPLPSLNQTLEVAGLPVCQPACSPPCQNGGTCSVRGACLCTANYRGEDCSEPCDDAPLCLHPPPIIKNADIYYNGSVAVVECHAGYELLTGLTHFHIYCDYDTWLPSNTHGGIDKKVLPTCDPVCQLPCLNGGICVGPNTCECPNQYRGATCQVPKQPECPTDPDAVANGFIHIAESGRSLTCAAGYQLRGGLVEASIWCQAGKWVYPRALYSGLLESLGASSAGTEDHHHSHSLSGSGFSEPQFSPCAPICDPPCRNRGVCVSPNVCVCPEPFKGPTCEQLSDEFCWQPPPTIGNASIMFSQKKASLICEEGYELASGERSVDLICRSSTWTPDPESKANLEDKCVPVCQSPCLHGGQCVAPNTCECPPEYQGPSCEEESPKPCPEPLEACPNTRLEYQLDENLLKLICFEGYGLQGGVPSTILKCNNGTWAGEVGGVPVSADELKCLPVCEGECLNGGKCVAPGVCECVGDFTGPNCDTKSCVPPATLRNNTIFYYDSSEGILDVQCKDGFRLPSGNLSAALLCKDGKWISPTGENTVFCLPSCYPPCLNGGRCMGPATCTCPEGFTGPTCSKRYSLSVKGTRCVFPFYYRGRMHHNCVRRSVDETDAAPQDDDKKTERLVDSGLLLDGVEPQDQNDTSSSETGGPWCPTTVDTFRRPLQWETCAGVVGPYAALVTKDREECVFPFKYEDKEYFTCTTAGDRPTWCATEVAEDGTALRWTACDLTYGLKSVTLTFQGSTCQFPFRYEGQWYDECISQQNSEGAWCASDLSPTGDLLQRADCILDWGHYQDYLTKAQKVCASPYTVDSVWYKGCQGEKPWCAVKVDQDRNVVKWALCDSPGDWPGVSVSLPTVPIILEVFVFSVTGERCLDVVAGAAKKVLKGCLVDGSLRGAPWCPLEMDDTGSVTKKGVCVPDWYLSFAPPWERKYIDAGPKKPVSRQTVDGQACVLPFKNKGKVYLDCAPHVPPATEEGSWCAVAVTDELEVLRFKNCKPEDDDHEGPWVVAVTNNIVTKQQRLCVLPFKFEGSVYFSCVITNGSVAMPGDHGWCATAVNENGEATERGDCPVISDRIDETILELAEECAGDDESSSLPFSLLPDSDSEPRSEGDGSDTRCIVPYVFGNQTYWDCTRAGTAADEDAWCATEIDKFRNVVKKQKCSTGWQLKESGDIKPVAWERDWLLDLRNTILGSGDLMSPKHRTYERYDTITGKECIFPFKSRDTNQIHTNCVCPSVGCEGDHRSVCATAVDDLGYMTSQEPCRGVLIRKDNFFDQIIST